MRLSPNGRKFLQKEEGLSLTAYPDPKLPKLADGRWDPKQNWSIGYGHSGAYEGQRITREEADALFVQDIAKYEAAVSYTVTNATQEQFDAMVALCYNIGTAGFAGSTVARLHDMGNYAGAADAFRMWRKSAGADNPVLVARRERERTIYLGQGYPGVDTWSSPAPAPVVTPLPSPLPSLRSVPLGWLEPEHALPPLAIVLAAAVGAYWMLPKVPLLRRAIG